MGFDKRSTPGPGQYEPRRSKRGGAASIGESPGAFATTAHGVSVDNGPSRDYSFRDHSITGPWIAYPRNETRLEELSQEGGSLFSESLPGAAGKQLLSTKTTGPRYVFGKAKRSSAGDEARGRSPGPASYDLTKVESVGSDRIVLGSKRAPNYSIGQKLVTIDKRCSPGPIYDSHTTAELGGMLDVSHSAVFGKAPRTPASKAQMIPGPGLYQVPSSMGVQTTSTRSSSPSNKFSRMKLSYELPKGNPVLISRQHVQDRVGRDSPGPQAHVGMLDRKGRGLLGGKGSAGVSFTRTKKLRPPSTEGFYCPTNPGPGAYRVRESMGRQVLSTSPTAGCVHRTTGQRNKWNKEYISAVHLLTDAAGEDSPGPAYLVETTSTGRHTLGKDGAGPRIGTGTRERSIKDPGPGPNAYVIRSTFDRPKTEPAGPSSSVGPGFSFSTETRPCLQSHGEYSPRGSIKYGKDIDQVLLQGCDAPGPGQYLNSKTGHLMTSVSGSNPTLKAPPGVKFSTGKRPGVELPSSSGDVGPGAYATEAGSSIGRQQSSMHRTAPGFKIGKTDKAKEGKVYISKLHAAADTGGGKESPGPGAYAVTGNWRMSSRKKSAPSFSFGSSSRSNFLYM